MFRLDRRERYALSKLIPLIPADGRAWLFGSRTDVRARGGDIDLLIEVDASPSQSLEISHMLTMEFQKHCEEKIDVVVLPKRDLTSSQKAFRKCTGTLIDLRRVTAAPLLDHVALLVKDLTTALKRAESLGFPMQQIETSEERGTQEAFVGEDSRPSRLLLIQQMGPEENQRPHTRPRLGLHHLRVCVPSVDDFRIRLEGTNWTLHSNDQSWQSRNKPCFVCFSSTGAPLLEVVERSLYKPPTLAPVVEGLKICVSEDELSSLSSVSFFDIPELSATSFKEPKLLINGHWRKVADYT